MAQPQRTSTGPTILQIIPELDTGGAELSTVEIAQAVVAGGGRAIVLSQGGRLAEALERAGGELVDFPAATKNPARMYLNARRIAEIARSEGVDLIHARSRAPAWSALLASRLAKLPFVTTYHGAYNEKGPFKKLYNSVMARADRVIANSRYTADLVVSRYGTAEDIIRVIHRGVDEDAFDPAAIPAERTDNLKRAWGVPEDAPLILNAARLTSWKGQEVVIAAAAELQANGKFGDAHVILAGDAQGRSGYEAGLRAQITEAGLSDRVHLVGHVSDMPAAFACAHLVVVASTEPEAFGRTATEAQVMGCPVIATAIGAPPETVNAPPKYNANMQTGWLVPPSDAPAMAAVMEEALCLPPDVRAKMGARARAHVINSFSLRAMKTKTMAVYDELLGTDLFETYTQKNSR